MIENKEIRKDMYIVIQDGKEDISEKEAKKKFECLKKNGIVKGVFEGDKFEIKQENYFLEIKITEIKSRYMKNIIKKILVLELLKKKQGHNLVKKINCVIKFLKFTNELTDKFDDYLQQINYMTNSQRRMRFEGVRLFLEYIDRKKYNNFLFKFSLMISYESKMRELPDYSSIIEFDYILKDYIENEKENFEKYYIVYLYWKITSVIPMRPKEFLAFKFNCIEKDNDEYYLIVSRIGKGGERNLFTEQKLLTTKEIALIIEKYKKITMKTRTEKEKVYLLCYSHYNKHLIKKNMAKKLKNNVYEMELGEVRSILKRFYKEVVVEKYNCQLDEIKLGDTRHLAFCSLMLRGVDPITIAELGNHTKITTQMNYQNHMENFVTSYIFLLAKKISLNKSIKKDKFSIPVIDYRNMKIREIELQGIERRKIENGYCYSEDFPNNCSFLNCQECIYFVVQDEGDKKSENLLEENMIKLNEKIFLWKEILNSLNTDIKQVNTKEIMERVEYVINDVQRYIVKCSNLLSKEEEI